ncbi:MAG TPA: glycosyltransferase [Chitinophagaceae bacterium]|nr:glycosyltransferase [Chitinophagaceae bacterium]
MEIQAELEIKPSASRIKPQREEPLRVLEAIRQGSVGGGESHVLGLTSHLDLLRYSPRVLSFTSGQMVDQLREMDIPVTVIPSTRAFDPRVYTSIKKLLRSERIQLVHVHGSRAASNLIFPARSLGIPVVYTIHGWSFHEDQPGWVRRLRILTERGITAATRANICVSEANQATGRKHIPRFRSEVIPNGIDLEKFDVEGSYRDIRAELGIPGKDTLVAYIARITRQKDPLTLIRAFREVCLRSEGITLLVVGDGDLREQAEQLAASLNLGARVIFQGFRLDTPDILNASDLYCLPSLWEGLPIGLIEAMAMGNAAIASRVDGTCEVIRHLENGWLMPPGNPQELATGILTLHRNRELRERIQKNALGTVRRHYNILGMTRKVEALYDRVMSRN